MTIGRWEAMAEVFVGAIVHLHHENARAMELGDRRAGWGGVNGKQRLEMALTLRERINGI